jgi:hypothetical protein
MEERIMAKLDDILADEQAMKDLIGSIAPTLDGLKKEDADLKAQVAALTAQIGISAADQAKIDAIFAQAEANKAALTAAITPTP